MASALDIRNLDGRYRCIIRFDDALWTAIISPEILSPSKEYIRLGDFYSDELPVAWRHVDQIQIVEVLAKVDIFAGALQPKRPTPPPGRVVCSACGTLVDGKHTGLICRVVRWLGG